MVLSPRASIDKIPPYKQGDRPSGGSSNGIKLSANESALGPSPAVKAALLGYTNQIQWYPDSNAIGVRKAISERYSIEFDKILMGVGSDELLKNLVAAYAGFGDEVIFSEITFPLYKTYTLSAGATPVIVKNKNFAIDVEGLLNAVSPKTKIVIFANPNNPTGTYINKETLSNLRAKLPDRILLIIDAAYAEYVDKYDYESGVEIVHKTDNTVMTRTFSKIHGLASLRLGWCYAHSNILSVVGRIRSPFNVSGVAQVAGEAAIRDKLFQSKVISHNKKWHEILNENLSKIGFYLTGTEGNFICLGKTDKIKITMDEIDIFLRKHNIITRKMNFFGLPNHLRVTIGKDSEMEKFLMLINEGIKSPK